MPLIPFNGSMKLREWWSKVFANDEYLEQKIDTHANNKNNPHGTTAAQVGAETPAGAQAKADAVQVNLNGHVGAGGTAHAAVTTSVAGFMTAVDKLKLNGVAAGAQVNQMSFGKISVSGQGDVDADEEVDTLTLKGGTGISITTNPVTDEVTITATGTATPGAHASSHVTGGTDIIPNAVAGGNSGLLSGADKTALDSMNTNLSVASSTAISLQRGVAVYTASRKSRLRLKQLAGRTLVNLLGRDGGCESSTVQTATGGTIATDTTTSLTGSASTKLTMSSTSSALYPSSTGRSGNVYPAVGDYYLTIAEAKHSNAAGQVAVSHNVSGVTAATKGGASATFSVWGIAWRAFNVTAVTTPGTSTFTPYVAISGASSNTVNIDSCRTYKITAAEYAALDTMTVAPVAAKYPYVDDAKSINAIYINNPGRNLLPPFVEWGLTGGDAKVAVTGQYQVQLVAPTNMQSFLDVDGINLVVGQTYTLSAVLSTGSYLQLVDSQGVVAAVTDTIPSISFTARGSVKARYSQSVSGTFTASNPMLVPGSTAAFEPQRPSYLYLPDCQLRSSFDGSVADTLYTDGQGRPRAVRRLYELTVDGSLSWAISTSPATVFKQVQVTVSNALSGTGNLVKYDGSLVPQGSPGTVSNTFGISSGVLYLSIPNTDSGWGNGYTPSADEIKAYFNGWKMYDGTASDTPYTSGTKYWRYITIPVGSATTTNGSATTTLPTTQVPGYTPYRLIYQLAASVDEPLNYEGDLMLHDGANQIEVGTGVVVREVAKPVLVNGFWEVNANGNNATSHSELSRRVGGGIRIYRNGILDSLWYISTDANAYGKQRAFITDALYDKSAAYSVTYLALDTHTLGIAPASVEGEYAPNVKEALDSITRDVTEAKTQLSVLQATKAQKQSPQWIAPLLINGWVNFDANLVPSGYYKDDSGIVRLRGFIKLGTLNFTAFYLPPGYRPKSDSYQFLAYSTDGTNQLIGRVLVYSDGRVVPYLGNNSVFCLDSVSFRAEQ